MKINDQFSAVRGHILMIQPLPTVSQTFRLIIQEENHNGMTNLEVMAFLADKRNFNFEGLRPNYKIQDKGSSLNLMLLLIATLVSVLSNMVIQPQTFSMNAQNELLNDVSNGKWSKNAIDGCNEKSVK